MPRSHVETTITSLWPDQAEHTYQTVPLGFDESADLALRLSRIAAGPLGDIFGGMMDGVDVSGALKAAGDGADADEVAKIADEEMAEAGMDAEDLNVLGKVLGELPQKIISEGGSKLLAEIFQHTTRTTQKGGQEGKDLILHLKKPGDRDHAFAGGNQAEALKALGWILMVNYAPFLMGQLPDFSTISQLAKQSLTALRSRS